MLSGPDCSIVARGRLFELRRSTLSLDHLIARWTPAGHAPVTVVSLRLMPPVFRMDYWNPACWSDYARDRHTRRAELSSVWARTDGASQGPLAIGGDFNTPPDPGTFAPLARELKDCFGTVGRGWSGTAHNTWAFARIDQVWVGRGLRPVSSWTVKTANSDHRMTVSDVAW